MDHIIRRVAGWTLFWYSSYRGVLKINSKKCPEYSCRIVTEIHALIATFVTCHNLFFSGTWPFGMLGLPNTSIQIQILCASLGYFIHDFLWCLYHMTEGPVMLLHHVISIATMSASLCMGVSGTEVLSTIFGSEISSIVLNFRWFMRFHKLHHSKLGMATDVVFVLLFVGVRILLGGYLTYCELVCSPAPLVMKLGGSCMYLVNCVFLVQVLSFARYQIRKYSKAKQNGEVQQSEQNGVKFHKEKGLEKGDDASKGVRQRKHGGSTSPG